MIYKNIFFDVDGTLACSHEAIFETLDYAFEKTGLTPPKEEYYKFIGPPIIHTLETFGITGRIAEDFNRHFFEYSEARTKFMAAPYEGIEAMLSDLKGAGKRLIVATGRRSVIAAQYVEAIGLGRYFDGVFAADFDRGVTHKPEIVAEAVAFAGGPEGGVMVGDRFHDVEGGRAAGLKTLFVRYGYGGDDEIALSRPDVVVDTVEELRNELMR